MADVVTVVIPTHNRCHLLQEAVESVLKQSFRDLQLVIVDDASVDGTWHWLESLSDPRVCIYRNDRVQERARSRNHGLDRATGEYVWFLDDDDRLRQDALVRLIEPMRRNSDAVAAVGAREFFGRTDRPFRMEHPRLPLKKYVWKEASALWLGVPSQTLFRTAVVRRLGGFRDAFTPVEDLDLFLRISWQGPVLIRPEVVAEYRQHAEQSYAPGKTAIDKWFRNTTLAREEFIGCLPAPEAQIASRILQCSNQWVAADDALASQRTSEAIRLYGKAFRAWPEVLVSPLLGPLFLRGFVLSGLGSIFGESAVAAVRSLKRRLFRRLH